MRVLTVTLMLLVIGLAGCAGDDQSPVTEGSGGDGSAGDGNETAAPTNGTVENRAPALSFTADVLNGTAPVNVTFTLDGTDADGDNLTWTLDIDGEEHAAGADLPTVISVSFEAGQYNATMHLSDGNATNTTTLVIQVAPAMPQEEEFQPVTMEQDILLACPHCVASDATAASACIGFQAGEQGVDCWWFEIDPTWIGRTLELDGSFLPGIEFHSSCDGDDVVSSHLAASITIPAGAGCVFVMDFVDPVITMVAKIS